MQEDLAWISSISEEALIETIREPDESLLPPESAADLRRRLQAMDPTQPIDKLGNFLLAKAIDGDVAYFNWPDYWQRLKDEFRVLVCTSDKRYASLRKQLATSTNKSRTAIVSTIAAGMAAQFGVVAGLLVPFVAMCLLVLVRVGKEAFCAAAQWNTPLIDKGKASAGK